MTEFIAYLLQAVHAIMLATEVDREDLQRYILCVSVIGWVFSAIGSQTQWC